MKLTVMFSALEDQFYLLFFQSFPMCSFGNQEDSFVAKVDGNTFPVAVGSDDTFQV